jgi:uncharacterized protein YlaI
MARSATGPAASRIVGKTAPVGNRMGYEVYEATRPYRGRECYDCGRLIEVGERFTRRTIKGGGTQRHYFCSDCEDARVADQSSNRSNGQSSDREGEE